jgi:hypothetical protein
MINQKDVTNSPEDNWPTPLVDPSGQLKIKVTHGNWGEQIAKTLMSTDGQDKLSLTEGRAYVKTGDMSDQGGHKNKLQTSQQQSPDKQSNPEPGDE